MIRYGIDLGGTKIEIIALDASGETLLRRRIPTPCDDYTAIVEAIAGLVEYSERETGQRGSVGIGTPGAASAANGRLKNSNTACLRDRPLRDDLGRRLGREVRIANDANCFALSEALDGAGAGAQVVFGVILGTGVGGGIVVDGRIIEGANSIAGEWGHNPLCGADCESAQARPCYCGKLGCVETWLSGPGMAAEHAVLHGGSLSALQIAQAGEYGDAAAVATLDRYARRLAAALGQVINILDPQVIVLGGGMSNVAMLYSRLPVLLQPHVFSDSTETRVLRNWHGDSGGVRGAAWLWGC